MKKFGNFICKNRNLVIILSIILLILSVIGMNLTKINYDILVYLPKNIETIKGQNILTDDFSMGAYSIAIIDNMNSKDVLKLENKIKKVNNVNKVFSVYDGIGASFPIEMLPSEIAGKFKSGNSTLLLITFNDSTSAENTINAVKEIRAIVGTQVKLGGMSSMVLDTMELSDREIAIYIVIAVALCLLVLELALDSYIVPLLLLLNIGCAILLNLGSNVFFGEISYITKALVAVLQLGVTTDFSIFLYHSYEKKKTSYKNREEAMSEAISDTFTSVTGSALTTIAGFLVLCTMKLTLGTDLGIVMAKGVFLGVITVLVLFPSLLLVFDKLLEKTKKKIIIPNFSKFNEFIIKNHKAIFITFIILITPAYLAYSKVDVYYKMDRTLPDTLESITANKILAEKFNIVSPEIILIDKNMKQDSVEAMAKSLEKLEGVDFVLSFSKIKSLGITEDMLSDELIEMFENDKYQMLLLNSTYEIASDELNNQVVLINDIVKKYDKNAIVAGEGPLMKDLIEISDTDFKNVNYSSIACIFIILFIVLKSFSLPFLLIGVIEFAIFVNMGVSYFNGTTLPFVAPIVLGTIQLGATIDYAILMTSTYLEKRMNGMEQKEAMLETLNYCGNSVFVSGMCFFAATFGVGMYSRLEMVGSLCTLISRGALISMITVITILPSILLIFDNLIFKTSNINGKEINMKNKIKNNTKRFASFVLIGGILISCIPKEILALTKNETVYSKLNSDGTVEKVLVNERLINSSKLETINDFAELENIVNTNNDSTYIKKDNKLIWNAEGKDIFYQGTTNKTLPISVKITYKLNDKETKIDDILGKAGKVNITLKYNNKDKHYTNYGVLYTPFVVTMGTIIDSETNSNITVTNGKVVSNGTKNIVVGLATPGLYESLNLKELANSDTITITYDTTNFSLSSIYSIVTPKLIDSSDLEIFNRMDTLYNSVNTLSKNMNTIDNGAKQLKDGSNKLKTRLEDAIASMSQTNSDTLTDEQISGIENKIAAMVKETFTDEYKANIAENTWTEVQKGLIGNDENITNIVTTSATSAASNAATKAVTDYLQNAGLYEDYLNCETGKIANSNGKVMTESEQTSCGIIASDKALAYIKQAAIEASGNAATSVATNVSGYVAKKVSDQVSVSVAEKTAITTASNISSSLPQEVANQVKNATIEAMIDKLSELYSGVSELDNGIIELSSGINKFNNEGITKLTGIINNDVRIITNKINTIVKLGEDYKTFTNTLDNTSGETKFILVVDSKEATSITNNEVAKKEDKITFWDRIKNLFNK